MIAILTALDIEHAAVRAHLTGVERHEHEKGTLYDVGVLAARPDRRIALASTGISNINAAVLTERTIAEFDPSMTMFVGIAGGLTDWLQLGDVVVATRVYAYHGGRSEDSKFRVRPRAWDVSHRAEQAARWLARSSDWRGPLPDEGSSAPAVHFAPIAAGDVLQDSRSSAEARHLEDHYNDAVAIEMESAGFAAAAQINESASSVTIRGISDYAGGAKSKTDGQGWREVAARNAAAFAVAVAADLSDVDEAGESAADAEAPPVPQVHNTNVAKGNARVGYQLGVNQGGIHDGSHRRDRS